MHKLASGLALVALLAGIGLTATQPTRAGWSKADSYTPPATRSSKFEQTVSDVSVNPTLHVGDSDLNPATSTPGLKIGLTSDRLNGNTDIFSFDAFLMKNASDSSATAATSDSRLFADSLVDVRTSSSSADCTTGIESPAAWTFGSNAVGNLSASNTYSTTRGYTPISNEYTAHAHSGVDVRSDTGVLPGSDWRRSRPDHGQDVPRLGDEEVRGRREHGRDRAGRP